MNTSRRTHLVRSTGIVIGAFVAAKALGLARELVIGRQFGTGGAIDAYYAAFQIPDLLFTLIAGGALVTAFLPVFTEYLVQGDTRGAWEVASAVTNLVLVVTAVLAGAVALLAPVIVERVVAPGFDPARQALTVDVMRIILASTVVFGVSGIQMGILNAYQHFLLPAVAPAMYNLGIIAGALILAPRWGVHGLAAGVVVGAVLHLGVKIPGLMRYGMQYSPVLGLRHPGVRQVAWLMGPRVLALGMVKLTFLVNTNLASRLGEGSVAALSYAWHVMQLPETLFATAVAIVVFPTLAEFAARGQTEALRSALADTLRVIFVLTVPAAVGLIVLGRPLIALLFQRGAFDARSTEMVYFALQFYALALIGHAVLEIAARLFYAQKDTLTPFKVATVSMLANVVLSLTLIRVLSYGGLALANALAFTLEASILLWIGRGRLGGLEVGRILDGLVRIGLAALVMGAAIIGLQRRLPYSSPLVIGATGLALGGLIYLAAILALGLHEARTLPKLVLRRLTR
ncbi:MAG: murein biosynthesis integral membrane protein MurJ [Anaerolineae bacterium]